MAEICSNAVSLSCRRCGKPAAKSFFPKGRKICRGCIRKQQKEARDRHPWKNKAVRVVETHAFKLGLTIVALRNEFGWKRQMIAVLMEDAFAGRCPCCGRPYRSIQDGKPRVLTLDIIIPSEPPCWTNTRFICIECNVIKGRKTGQELFNALEDRKRYFSEPSPKDPQMDFLDPVYQETLLDKELNANKLDRYIQSPLTAIEPHREQAELSLK